ncbi:odorant receptor 49a-like [Acyrthosiphon pisum]|uniref:Odorant receptor n=1 Tax=Acyrthosiphon pisum TaxID=7029 RepID=A0A8R2H8C9_ACYPI|nr:odorant receptor 49a-like [Acyrthosiphon pisum]|eukprot:XP_016663583.1 PREDICTED: odorant receptor 49a-like [Acyrthosiphon pisum]
MTDIVEIFLQRLGCSDDGDGRGTRRAVFFTYCESAITLFFAVLTYLSLVYSSTGDNLSIRIYGLLCFVIEIYIFAYTAVRVYHQSEHHDMYQRSRQMGIPENYRRKIATVIKYHLVMSNVVLAIPMLCTILLDELRMGDPFTFPFADVMPIKTANVTVYVCKYILYALHTYFAHLELCFLNVTFMYSTGVVKRHFQVLDEQVEEAMVTEDEQKLKIAIIHHQQVLKFFKDMKTVYEKPLLLTIEGFGLYIGLCCCAIIQVIQGFVDQIILGLCMASCVAGFMTISLYCICASNMYDLQNGILNSLYEHRACYSRNKSFKRLNLIMMTRATIPLEFNVYSLFIVNLNLLVKILKLTYSVLNVLLTTINLKFKETAT